MFVCVHMHITSVQNTYQFPFGLHVDVFVDIFSGHSTAFYIQGPQTFSCQGSYGIAHSYQLYIHYTPHIVFNT